MISEPKKYFGNWSSVDDVNRDFEIGGEARLRDDEVLFASYEYELYDGYAVVILQRNGALMEVAASHCSCHGLEGQLEPAPVTWEALALRLKDLGPGNGGFMHQHSVEAANAFRDLVMSHVPAESGDAA